MINGLRAAGVSCAEIGRQAGMARETISRYGNGEIRRPSADNFRRVADVFQKLNPPHRR